MMMVLWMGYLCTAVQYDESHEPKPWRSFITFNGQEECLGYYATQKEAYGVYKERIKGLGSKYRGRDNSWSI